MRVLRTQPKLTPRQKEEGTLSTMYHHAEEHTVKALRRRCAESPVMADNKVYVSETAVHLEFLLTLEQDPKELLLSGEQPFYPRTPETFRYWTGEEPHWGGWDRTKHGMRNDVLDELLADVERALMFAARDYTLATLGACSHEFPVIQGQPGVIAMYLEKAGSLWWWCSLALDRCSFSHDALDIVDWLDKELAGKDTAIRARVRGRHGTLQHTDYTETLLELDKLHARMERDTTPQEKE